MSKDKLMKRQGSHDDDREVRVRTLSPACDVFENADEYLVIAEMPGVDEGGIDLQLERTQLEMSGVRTLASGSSRGEAAQIRYERTFEVPDTIDGDGIRAQLAGGVLSVHLPKAPRARVRRIAITGA